MISSNTIGKRELKPTRKNLEAWEIRKKRTQCGGSVHVYVLLTHIIKQLKYCHILHMKARLWQIIGSSMAKIAFLHSSSDIWHWSTSRSAVHKLLNRSESWNFYIFPFQHYHVQIICLWHAIWLYKFESNFWYVFMDYKKRWTLFLLQIFFHGLLKKTWTLFLLQTYYAGNFF